MATTLGCKEIGIWKGTEFLLQSFIFGPLNLYNLMSETLDISNYYVGLNKLTLKYQRFAKKCAKGKKNNNKKINNKSNMTITYLEGSLWEVW